MFTVLIPAHNEERAIGRLLALLAPDGAVPDAAVIVLCNGCSDATAATARQVAPWACVTEIEQPGKANAINRGLAMTQSFPVIVVDADIQVSLKALTAVAEALRAGECRIAAPQLIVDSRASSWPVRAYYRVWLAQPYVTEDLVGSGVFGLTREAVEIVGQIPPIIADDAFVRTRFARSERRSVTCCQDGSSASFTVTAPSDLGSLLKIEARRRAGDAEIRQRYPGSLQGRDTTIRSLAFAGSTTRPGALDRLVYGAIKLGGRVLYQWNRVKRRERIWFRDESSRQ